jgi:hypothetical protein
MGLFGKKEEKKEGLKLPSLPKLPELPNLESPTPTQEPLTQLPSFPNNSFGQKFSQNTIKEAVTGKKEVEAGEGISELPTLGEAPIMQSSPAETIEKDFPSERKIMPPVESRGQFNLQNRIVDQKPIFIRLDKFEESLHNFTKIKEQIMEVEELLSEIKRTKEDEEKELNEWEMEMQNIKKEIGNIDGEIFSRI